MKFRGQEVLTRSRKIFFALGMVTNKNWKKNLSTFLFGVLLLMTVLSIPATVNRSIYQSKRVLGTATTGFEFLKSGDVGQASKSFDEAREQIRNSESILLRALDYLPVGDDLENILAAGSHIASAMSNLMEGVSQFQMGRIVWDSETNSSDQSFYQSLKASHEKLARGQEELGLALARIEQVNENFLPDNYREEFEAARKQVALANSFVENLRESEKLFLNLLGGDKKTYVMIFQNNNEIRATGGFIGTYGILEFENGNLSIPKIESIYAIDGQLNEIIAPPGPLIRLVTQTWGMRDSNWFVDFPSSSRKILDFFEKETGILADGVVAFTPDLFEKLLTVTGPIEMPEYGEILNSENFRAKVQFETSLNYDRELNQPKKFLADFAPRFLLKLQSLDLSSWLKVLAIFSDAIEQKQILAFSLDEEMQHAFEKFQVDAGIKQTEGDFLAIFHSSAGGGKTDQNIPQEVEKKVSIDSGGLAIVKLKIKRTHNGFDEKFFPKNVDFMRILVPRNSRLLSATGFDDYELLPSSREGAITDSDLANWDRGISYDGATSVYIGEEAGYKFFANWLKLLPGESKTVELTYEVQLPNTTYTLLLQKQPGSNSFDFSLEINYLAQEIAYFYPENLQLDNGRLLIRESVNTDKFYGVIGK